MVRVLLNRGGAGTMSEGEVEISGKRSVACSKVRLRAWDEGGGGAWSDLW